MKYIAKIERDSLILFFPENRARSGFLSCWTMHDGHNEACTAYYRLLKNPNPDYAENLKNMVALYEAMPPGPLGLVRVLRDNEKMRLKRHSAES